MLVPVICNNDKCFAGFPESDKKEDAKKH